MFEGLQAIRTEAEDRMENTDVRTMRFVLLPSWSISNYKKFTASDKLFPIPFAIKADILEPRRRADLPTAFMGKFKSSAFPRGKCVFLPLSAHYRGNFLKLQGFVLFDLDSASVLSTRDDVAASASRPHATCMISGVWKHRLQTNVKQREIKK